MSDFAGDRRPLVERIRSVRGSLRGQGASWPEETPVEEYERRRFERGFDGKERLAACLLAWLATHGIALLLFVGGLDSQESWRDWPWWRALGPAVFGLLSVGFATAAAFLAVLDRPVLRRRWTVTGLMPWAALVAESTALLLVLR